MITLVAQHSGERYRKCSEWGWLLAASAPVIILMLANEAVLGECGLWAVGRLTMSNSGQLVVRTVRDSACPPRSARWRQTLSDYLKH